MRFIGSRFTVYHKAGGCLAGIEYVSCTAKGILDHIPWSQKMGIDICQMLMKCEVVRQIEVKTQQFVISVPY